MVGRAHPTYFRLSSIIKRLCKFLTRLLLWGVLPVGLATAAALMFLLNRVDEEIRGYVQSTFARAYPGLLVTVHSAQRLEDQGIFVRGVSIKDPQVDGPQSELLFVDEVFLQCETTLDQLLEQRLSISHIIFRRLNLRAVRHGDGRWNLADLWPPPSVSDVFPPMSVENGTIELWEESREAATPLVLRNINLSVLPREDLRTTPVVTHAKGPCYPPLEFSGSLNSEHAEKVDLAGIVDTTTCGIQLGGSAQRVKFSPTLLAALPPQLTQKASGIGNLRGLADFDFSVVLSQGEPPNTTFSAEGEFYDGTWDTPTVPNKFTNIRTSFAVDQQGWSINGLTAAAGATNLRLSMRKQGFADDSPIWLTASTDDLQLDSSIAQLLPESLRVYWYQYLPSGQIDADLTMEFDGKSWSPDLLINCSNVAFTYYRFPYPITHTTGTIRLKQNHVAFNLTGLASSQALTLNGSLTEENGSFTGSIDFATRGNIPIDEKLLTALDTPNLRKAKTILTSLDAQGKVSASGRFERVNADDPEFHHQLHLGFADCAVQYEKFPYPLRKVSGTADLVDGEWTFRDFIGQNDSGRVACQGSYALDDRGGLLAVDFNIANLPLEDELRDALPPEGQKAWKDLRPRGTLDRAQLNVRYRPADDTVNVRVIGQKLPAEHNVEAATISLYPIAFPYGLNHVVGSFVYENGRLDFTNLQAQHGEARLAASGFSTSDDEGNWVLQFSQLAVDQLRIDRDLLSALPAKMASSLAGLNVVGALNMTGGVRFTGNKDPQQPVATSWDVTVDMENGSLNGGEKVGNIHGGARFFGRRDAEQFYSRGELAIDSMIFQGHQITGVTGPIWIDPTRVSFGRWADTPPPGQQPRRVTGKVYDGTINADLHVALDEESRYVLHADLSGADLGTFSRVSLPRGRGITGKASGRIQLGGTCSRRETLRGAGQLFLSDADIYELPLMVALLKIVSIRPPDSTAFTDSNIDFQIAGEHIYLSRVDFNGDAISLKGNGDLSFDGDVRLKFYTQVGRDQNPLSLIRPLLADASRRFLLIEVTGTLENPYTTRNVLPGLNNTLEQIFSEESARRPNPAPPSTPTPLSEKRGLQRLRIFR